jgi:hypothetical protein
VFRPERERLLESARLQRAGDGTLPSRTFVVLPENKFSGSKTEFVATECNQVVAATARQKLLAQAFRVASVNHLSAYAVHDARD